MLIISDKSDRSQRRTVLKTIAGLGTTASTIGLLSTNHAVDVAAAEECPECWSKKATYDAFTDTYKAKLASTLQHIGPANYRTPYNQPNYWSYHFNIAGHAVAIDEDEDDLANQLTSTNVLIESNSTYLDVFTSKDDDQVAIYPDPTVDGDDAMSVATGALGAAATIANSSFTSLALSATSMADGMVNAFSNISGGDVYNKYGFAGNYVGVPQAGHNINFAVRQYGTPYEPIKLKSEADLARNAFDLYLNDGNVSVANNSDIGPLRNPDDMTTAEKSHYQVETGPAAKLLGPQKCERRGISPGEKITIANNPPITAKQPE